MRLTPDQTQAIRQRIHNHMGENARIWLFGSRVDDNRRGGDVDLYVEPETAPDLTARLRCRSELADALDLNVDLIVQQPRPRLAHLPNRQTQWGAAVTDHLKSGAVLLRFLSPPAAAYKIFGSPPNGVPL